MLEGGELNVSNPVYMRKDPDDEDDDEMEPLGARDIYTGNSVRNSGLMHSLRWQLEKKNLIIKTMVMIFLVTSQLSFSLRSLGRMCEKEDLY